jgi:ring-1,2-phenylacetyl-CoA epoxidase subunit PaaC
MIPQYDSITASALAEYCKRLGDDSLILGQRLSELCGHGPVLEEDIAITNIALDLIGQTRAFYSYACELLQDGLTEDDIAYKRDVSQFLNHMIVEQPNGDFAMTMMRQFLISSYLCLLYRSLSESRDSQISGIAAKSLKEVTYHLRHSSEWVIRLGDGTDESHERSKNALEELWSYIDELFETNDIDDVLTKSGIIAPLNTLKNEWIEKVKVILKRAGLSVPDQNRYQSSGGINGVHTEYMGYILAEMQFLQRAYPNSNW